MQPEYLGYNAAEAFLTTTGITVPAGQSLQICTDNQGQWQAFHQYALDELLPSKWCITDRLTHHV
jgi:hypothetical protein